MAVLDSHRNLLSGKTALVRYDDANRLRQELSRAVRDRFAPIALDLSMMRLYPVSGFVQKIGDREVLVTVYQGAGPAITCFTLLGSESDAPERAQHFYDSRHEAQFLFLFTGRHQRRAAQRRQYHLHSGFKNVARRHPRAAAR